jgi:short-subunit dehydrogenase
MVAGAGRIDVLVNNAGVIGVGPLETQRLEDFEEMHAIMFWGVVHTTLAVLPQMRERGDGRIANVTSIGGKISVPYLLPYNTAKFAAVGFSTGVAHEAAKDGVRVTTIVPGLMRTGSFVHALVKGRRGEEATLFSIASSLPVLTMDARRAARRIVQACARGERFVVLGFPAKALRLAAALAPSLMGAAMELVARLLPGPAGDAREPLEPIWKHRRAGGRLTRLGDEAAAANNELPGTAH